MKYKVALRHASGSQISSAAFEMSSEATAQDAMTEGMRILKESGVGIADSEQWEAEVCQMWPMKD